jgi:predicted glycoside hydrolase/deacetylase ChbG (UPF0249 family)
VNADDLGLHEDINRGIEQAHTQGIVTSASVVACGEAFDHAVEILRTCPNLEVGVHLTLVGGERPLSPPQEISSLVGADGRFPHSYRQFIWRLWRARPAEISRELDAQIRRVQRAGLKPTHLDGHQHVLRVWRVWSVVKELAWEHGIRSIRRPWYEWTSLWVNRRSPLDPVFRAGLNLTTLATTSQTNPSLPDQPQAGIPTIGLDFSGRLSEETLSNLITGLGPGIFELVTHPGVTTDALRARYPWDFEWSQELAALTSPRIVPVLESSGVRLARFSEA